MAGSFAFLGMFGDGVELYFLDFLNDFLFGGA